jgi:RNA polymerase sigma-70 factor (ECF subfamily)
MIQNQENILFLQIQKGNLKAFETLYFDMQPRLFAFSRKFIDDIEICRDIVQEIFHELWENRQTTLIKTSVKAYLFRVLHNKCLNHIRDKKVQDKYISYVDFKLKETELLFFNQDWEGYKSIFFQEVLQIFKKSMEELPEGCREVMLMSRVEGLSNKEIAEKLDISLRTVENQIYRALKILKVNLKDYLPLFLYLLSGIFN